MIPRLRLQEVSRTYENGVRALDRVSLDLGPGLYGLLGPNGAGKSSLMRTIATLQPMDSGRITFDGQDIFADVTAHRARLGYLPQDFGVYPGVSARSLLDHLAQLKGLTHRGTRHAEVEALLHQVNLWEHRHRAVSSFSGGMRQRFGIAHALLGTPQLLIVDEPTAGLDPAERARFYNLLAAVGEEVVVLLSTHIVEDVRQLCSRVAILVGGRIVREGVLDVPPWPDTVMPAADVLKKLGIRSAKLEGRFGADSWHWSTMAYYLGQQPDTYGRVMRYAWLDRAHLPWGLKAIWAHHRYLVGLKEA